MKKKFKNLIKLPLLPVIILLLLIIPAFKDTISVGYYPMHDDLQVMRQLILDKCFRDGQIPCRWSEDMGYGFGYPLFNFYPPLPYYYGQLIHWLGASFTDTVKILVVLNFIVSGLAMYLLAKEFWGKWGGLIAAIFYVYAPYHSVDIYVRAAMNESWALALFPLVFWSAYKLLDKNKWIFVPVVSLSMALVMLSHNPILMIFSPFAACWILFWLIRIKNFKVIPKLLLSGFWAFGLAAFFTLPVIFEQQYVHVETLVIGYFNYLAHFATVNQLFISRFWGYGASKFGPDDGLSFQIGHLHWILSLVSLIISIKLYKKNRSASLMILVVFTLTLFSAFMTHQRSSFIWAMIPSLEYLQFPWRFLTLTIFGTSFLAGSFVLLFDNVRNKLKNLLFIVIISGSIFFYKDYFHWERHWPWVNDQVKFSGELWNLQIRAGIFDYLPKWAKLPPAGPPNGNAEMVSGEGQIKTLSKNSIKQEYDVEVKTGGVFQINTFYFPGWVYSVDNKSINIDPEEDKELGRPRIKLSPGKYFISAKLVNTPIRTLGNTLSIISWLGLITAAVVYFKRRNIVFKNNEN